LRELRVRGARDLRRVVFKETRRTIFSLTGGGTVLNLNVAFRQAPEPVPGSSFRLPADLVIEALGFDPEDLPTLWGAPELPVTRWGTIRIDWSTMATSIPGVFAAGDIVRGASLVVWAIRDGRDAAAAIHRWLEARARGAEAAPRELALAS